MCFLFWKNANWMGLLSSYKRQTGLFETRRYGFGDKYVITPKIYGYVRVSTHDQSMDSQKNLISRYGMDHKWMVDEWIELEMSSRKSTTQRRIDELLEKLNPDDIVITSELSRLGRSIKETLNTIEVIVNEKQTRLILIKQNMDINLRISVQTEQSFHFYLNSDSSLNCTSISL